MLKKKKPQVLLFLGSVGRFLSFLGGFKKKKKVGSGLILGSVGLCQYNNFFFFFCLIMHFFRPSSSVVKGDLRDFDGESPVAPVYFDPWFV